MAMAVAQVDDTVHLWMFFFPFFFGLFVCLFVISFVCLILSFSYFPPLSVL